MAGNVDDAGFDSVRKAQRSKPEVERHAAFACFGPSIRVVSGQRDDERAFAVIDVAGSSDYSHVAAATNASARRTSCSGETVRRSSTSDWPSTRPTTGGRPRRRRAAYAV